MITPILTRRLSMRHIQEKDAPFIFELVNSKGWLQYIGDRGVKSLDDAQTYIKENIQKPYGPAGYGLHGISLKGSSDLIGLCGLLKRDFLPFPDLGFAILPEYGGKCYIKEASLEILSIARTHPQLSSINAFTSKENERSIGLLTKLGFSFQEVFDWDGTALNLYVYNL